MILVDSSVWIEMWSRKESPITQALIRFLERDEAGLNGLIYTEILQGARNQKEFDGIKESLEVVPLHSFDEDLWPKAAELFFMLRQKGLNVTTIDCLIAQHALLLKIPLFSKDKIFQKISLLSKLELFH